MVSGWMENGDLMSYLRLRPKPNRMRLVSHRHMIRSRTDREWVKCMDVCAGLSYLHTNGMVSASV